MRVSLIVLASIGSLVASSAAFAAAPYANTAAAPAIIKHQTVTKVAGTSYAPAAKSGVKSVKKIHKVAAHKHHKKIVKHAVMKAM